MKKNSIEWQIYADIWSFHKKYYDLTESDGYWNAIAKDSAAIRQKYEHTSFTRFVEELLLAVTNQLEDKKMQERG